MTYEALSDYLLTTFKNVFHESHYGYDFFFVGQDRRLPFVTIATQDSEYDNASTLSRTGVFRLNVGVKKETFKALFPEDQVHDLTTRDQFLPHPDYAAQFWLCILSPSESSEPQLRSYIEVAYGMAKERDDRLIAREANGDE